MRGGRQLTGLLKRNASAVDTRHMEATLITRRRRAALLVIAAVLLEIVLIMPFVDHLADANPTIHFTQHGFIFLGGVLMGFALREARAGA